MLAYWHGRSEAANALIEAGADFTQKDALGNDAGWYAWRLGQGRVEQLALGRIRASVTRLSMSRITQPAVRKAKAGLQEMTSGATPASRRSRKEGL
jgi:hypothetical protein